MKEITRWDIDWVHEEQSDSGEWVYFNDHSAIVAGKDASIAELKSTNKSVTENYLRVTAERNDALYKVIELQNQLRAGEQP